MHATIYTFLGVSGEWELEGMGTTVVIPAHLYTGFFSVKTNVIELKALTQCRE